MSLTLVRAVRWTAIAAGAIAYPLLAYFSAATSAAATFPSLGVAVSLTPPLAILFWSCSIEAWSIFANFLSPPLIVLMFVAEYLVRLRKLPHLERHSIMKSILAFRTIPKVSSGTSPQIP